MVARCRRDVAVAKATSHGIRMRQECYLQRGIGLLGYPIPPRRSSFPTHPRGLPLAAVPRGSRLGIILSRALLPSRVSRAITRPAEPGTSHGLPSLFAASIGGVHSRGHPVPASFRPRRFARPRRFPPPPTLRVYFTPQPRPGFALQGVPLARSRAGSSPAGALLSFAPLPCRRLPDSARKRRPPSGLFSARESVTDDGGLGHRPLATLLSFPLLRVLLRAPRGRPSSPSPTSAFHDPRRLADTRPDVLLRANLPRPRFPA
jgi:hypothetical protein